MKIVLMRGIYGSGKSTYVHKITSENSIICSADHYFLCREGTYNFDASKLSEAHAQCLRRFMQPIVSFDARQRLDIDVLVVDNTNTTALELAPYVAIATAYGYRCEIVTVECNPYLAHQRNIHGVSFAHVYAMAERLKKPPPIYWEVDKMTVQGGQ